MGKYQITIIETLKKTIPIKAESEKIAVAKAESMYRTEDIILAYSDLQSMQIESRGNLE